MNNGNAHSFLINQVNRSASSQLVTAAVYECSHRLHNRSANYRSSQPYAFHAAKTAFRRKVLEFLIDNVHYCNVLFTRPRCRY
jgi:hypothetical protein